MSSNTLLRRKTGMTTGSRSKHNGVADSARRMTKFWSGHRETRRNGLSADFLVKVVGSNPASPTTLLFALWSKSD